MVELSIMNPAWQNYLIYLNDTFNRRGRIATVESITEIINREYNGIVTDRNEWRVYFKSDKDLAYFLLKWS